MVPTHFMRVSVPKQNSLSNEGRLVISLLLDANPDEFVIVQARHWLQQSPEDDRVKTRIAEKLDRLGGNNAN